jgi:hypothetical protein
MRTLGIYQAFKEDRPANDEAKLRGIVGADPERASSQQVAKAQAYLALVRKRKRVWDHHYDRAYDYLVGACDSQQSPMEVVYAHAAAVAALPEGAPSAGQDPTASKLLAALVARFSQAKNIGVVQAAIAEFISLSLASNERLKSFINRLTAAMRRLHALGQTDMDLDVYCLGRLKESLAHDSRQIAMTLRINTKLSWEEAVEMLLSYEQTLAPGLEKSGVKTFIKGVNAPEGGEVVRRLQAEVRHLNKALLHKGAPNGGKDRGAIKGFNGKCFDCGGPHKKADCPKKGNKGAQDKGNTCSYCHKTGHTEKACFKKKKVNQDKQADRAGVDDDFGGFVDEDQPTHRLMREYALSMKAGADPDPEIVLDSGASFHFLTPVTADQIELVPRKGRPTSIVVATAKTGIDFAAATESGSAGGLSIVLVSDELGADVASIARFDRDNGWHTLLGDTRCTVYDGDPMDRSKPPPRVIATGALGRDNMYRVSLSKLVKAREYARIARVSVPTQRIMQADAAPAETLALWHLRLGHHHLRGISEGVKQGLIKGPNLTAAVNRTVGLCSACEQAKSQRRAFSDGRRAEAEPGHTRDTLGLRSVKRSSKLVVTDLKGPFSVAGRGGEQYFQLFTDADDKYRVVKFLSKNSDSLRTLREFLLVDVQAEGMMVENLQADGAPELISAASVELVAKQGGKLPYRPPYTPEMNGIAERVNQTLYNAGYAILLSANLPESFWVQAISYEVIIYNFLPTNTLTGRQQPFKGRFGRAGSVARFRIWGCIAV